ncbi:DNA-3-methyladenine glycosylase family protein [Luteibacter sp.]|uniref:DNA-3-methyladenine glycosylase family protein n=1 Tax=Luteibacter sp. TaxID=1886636 RepID=UPI003F7E1F5C
MPKASRPHGHSYTADELRALRAELVRLDPSLAVANAAVPEFAWRSRPANFSGLLHLVAEQQVSLASAAAIWKRIQEGLHEVTASAVIDAGEERMRELGMSKPKARYAVALARAEQEGRIDFAALAGMDDNEAVASLTALLGIGRWTAEAFLIGAYGRTDFFPAADIALQEAARLVDGGEHRPTEKELYTRAERWKPFRAVAAQMLWGYYSAVKNGTAIPPPVHTAPAAGRRAARKPR